MTVSIITKRFAKSNAINSIVREKVIEVIREILADPDYGLEIRPDFIKRLKKSIEAEKKGKIISLDKILKKYKI